MAFTGEEQAFCTLQFEASRSIKTTMRKFSSKFKKKSPSNKSIKKWHSNFVKTGQCTTPRKAPLPTVPWPPRSLDLTSCDFFLWGFIKSKVYSERSATIEELRERIKKAFQEHITVQICRQVLTGYQRRLQRCLENNGGQVETVA